MNRGVSILLARMRSHPEEFFFCEYLFKETNKDNRKDTQTPHVAKCKWASFLQELFARVEAIKKEQKMYFLTELPYLCDEDVMLLYNTVLEIQGDEFTKMVVCNLFDDDKQSSSDDMVNSIENYKAYYKQFLPEHF